MSISNIIFNTRAHTPTHRHMCVCVLKMSHINEVVTKLSLISS